VERRCFRKQILPHTTADERGGRSPLEAIPCCGCDGHDRQRVWNAELKDRVAVDEHALPGLPDKRDASLEEHAAARLKLRATAKPRPSEMSEDRCAAQHRIKALSREEGACPDVSESSQPRRQV